MMIPEIPQFWQLVTAWAISLTAVGGCLYGLYRIVLKPRVVRPLRAGWEQVSQTMADVRTLKTAVAGLTSDVSRVKEEITTNGGSKTLKDSVSRIEKSMDLTHGKLTAIIDTSTQPIMQADASGRCTDVNRSFELLTGYSRPELLGWGWAGVIHKHDRDNVMDDWSEAVKHGRFFSHDFRFVTRDQHVLEVRVLAKPMLSTTGQVMGWHAVVERVVALAS